MNFRYGFTRFNQTNVPLSSGFDLTGAGFSKNLASMVDPQALAFPNLVVNGLASLGTSTPNTGITNYHTWQTDFSYTRGNHMIRFGGEFRLYRENNSNFPKGSSEIDFGNTWTRGPLDNSPVAPTGQGLASFLLGIPTGGLLNINASSAEQSWITAFYIQDDWRITPTLTLNAGLRYDYEAPVTERFDRSVLGFDATAASGFPRYIHFGLKLLF